MYLYFVKKSIYFEVNPNEEIIQKKTSSRVKTFSGYRTRENIRYKKLKQTLLKKKQYQIQTKTDYIIEWIQIVRSEKQEYLNRNISNMCKYLNYFYIFKYIYYFKFNIIKYSKYMKMSKY